MLCVEHVVGISAKDALVALLVHVVAVVSSHASSHSEGSMSGSMVGSKRMQVASSKVSASTSMVSSV